jgi:16S rRNA (cytosine967-C5)-methyltransferase
VDVARDIAFETLRAIEAGSSWRGAWALGRQHLEAARSLDRRFAHELASGCVRLQGRLDWIVARHASRPIERLDPAVRVLLRLGAYQLLELDRVAEHAAVHATVELAKRRAPHTAGFVNAVLRSVQRGGGEAGFPARDRDPLGWLVATSSHPRWLLERWLARFGMEATMALAAYDNRRPELCLRVNPQRTTRAALLEALPGSVPGRWSEVVVRGASAAFQGVQARVAAGEASVQDEAAALVAPLLGPQPGQRLLDLAAAPGGKACHLAERLAGTGVVCAFDKSAAKLEKVRANAVRLGLENIVTGHADLRELRLEPADGVLLDAPCSGLGVLARRPDLRWRKRPEDLPRLQTLQLELLEAAATLVRPGGLLVYSVCSFEPEETSEVQASFTARHPEMRPDDGGLPQELRAAPGVLYLFPHAHGTDGGFAARWRRAG